MLLDTSALVALVAGERESPQLFDLLADAALVRVGAPSLVEAALVLDGRSAHRTRDASSRLALVMARFEIEILPFEARTWPVAWAAFLRYGKGRHPAALNFGDCLVYGLARLSGEPLLCLGNDFAQTDLELVPLPG
jgi:ribonuclease VapC